MLNDEDFKILAQELTDKVRLTYLEFCNKIEGLSDDDYEELVYSVTLASTANFAFILGFDFDQLTDNLKHHYDNVSKFHKNNDLTEDEEYLFSEELRKRMSKFGDMDINECLSNPDFYKELLDHAGISKEEQKKLWEKVKSPQFYRE